MSRDRRDPSRSFRDKLRGAMPGQHGGRGHQPVATQIVWQNPGQRGEHRPVRPVQLRTGDPTAQHGDLAPQREDLGLLRGLRPAKQDQSSQQRRHDQVEQAGRHRPSSCPTQPSSETAGHKR